MEFLLGRGNNDISRHEPSLIVVEFYVSVMIIIASSKESQDYFLWE